MIDQLKSNIRRRAARELVGIFILSCLSLLLFASFDVAEQLFAVAQKYESIELDELFVLAVLLSALFAVFAFRRWQDVLRYSAYCEELSMLDPITHLPNRRAIARLLKHAGKQPETGNNSFPLSLVGVSVSGFEFLQTRLGSHVAERAMLEVLYRISKLVSDDVVLANRSANECVAYCPNTDARGAESLVQAIDELALESCPSAVGLLTVKAKAITLVGPEAAAQALDQLERRLFGDSASSS